MTDDKLNPPTPNPIDPTLMVPKTPEDEEKAMIDVLAGMSIQDAADKHNIMKARLRTLTQSENFEVMKKEMAREIADQAQIIMTQATLHAARALTPSAFREDPKLALQFLKEQGGLKRNQRELGQEFDDTDGTIRVVIDNFGLDAAQPADSQPPTIDVPSTRVLDEPET